MATPKDLIGGGAMGTTVIGESILVSGKLTGDEDLTVRGRVEGELSLTKTLIVEPSGVVKANVSVRNVVVSGVVVGNIQATESVELTREGRMVGDIRAPRVIIVDGASFRGHVDMGEVEPGRAMSERPARPVVRPTVRPTAAPARATTPPTAVTQAPARAATGKPMPPPAPSFRPKEGKEGKAPAAPVVASSKKKVVVKKKG
jgi:cytoskeletal protein CcmA (bactofilin family)